jgi:methylated-DNA-[protein]-cysteine S-methyltransferase
VSLPESGNDVWRLDMSARKHYSTSVDSPFGRLVLIASDAGLCYLKWPGDRSERLAAFGTLQDAPGHTVLAAARRQLEEYFAGTRTEFDIPFDLAGTDFQRRAWMALAAVPFGTTTTYSEQAERLGARAAVRAVGAANGRNPVSIILPCHRVVGKDGSLTGYAGGLETKRALLDHEQEVMARMARQAILSS